MRWERVVRKLSSDKNNNHELLVAKSRSHHCNHSHEHKIRTVIAQVLPLLAGGAAAAATTATPKTLHAKA